MYTDNKVGGTDCGADCGTDCGADCGRSAVRVGLVSLGCPKNQVDSEAMLGILSRKGYTFTPDADMADIIIVNTCGFIESAKSESIAAILDMADRKETGSCRAIVVTGCLSERYRDSFLSNLPEADEVLGIAEYYRIGDVIDCLSYKHGLLTTEKPYRAPEPSCRQSQEPAYRQSQEPARQATESTGQSLKSETWVPESPRIAHLGSPRILTDAGAYVYIKVSEGCDNRCTYCAIPSIRGTLLSRRRKDIVSEARELAKDRDIEAVLVAQDTTRYAADFHCADTRGDGSCAAGLRAADFRDAGSRGGLPPKPLLELIDELSQIERIRWIRLLYCYPECIDENMIELLAKEANGGKLLPYLDLPIQHASDRVLRRMGRRYSRKELDTLISELRTKVPGIVLRTTLMTGFPGETEEDFLALLDFVKTSRFDRLGVFAFSREDGTAAAEMDGQVTEKVSQRRRAELLRASASVVASADSARIGKTYTAVLDAEDSAEMRGGIAANSRVFWYAARTYAEAPKIDGFIRVSYNTGNMSDKELPKTGDFTRIRIFGSDMRGLYGEIVDAG